MEARPPFVWAPDRGPEHRCRSRGRSAQFTFLNLSVTDVELFCPAVSVTVSVTTYVPADEYVCDVFTSDWPLEADEPSPKFHA